MGEGRTKALTPLFPPLPSPQLVMLRQIHPESLPVWGGGADGLVAQHSSGFFLR